MKKIKFMDTSFRDGFQSCFGARVKTEDFIPALEAAVAAGTTHFEIGGGARFQSLYFYCQQDAFEMMDACRAAVGPDINLQTLARGANVVGLISQSRDIIDLHAKMFKKHGVTTIRNFDALNDVRNLAYSGSCIHNHGLKHQATVTLMGLPPGLESEYAHTAKFYVDCLKNILDKEIPFDSVCFKDASGTATPKVVYDAIKEARKMLPEDVEIEMHSHSTAGMAVSCYMAAIEAGADVIDLGMRPVSGGTGQPDILTMWHRLKGTDYTLDIDYEKIMEAERVFMDQMDKYFMPPEALEVNPVITLSPMPGGALTANTQMMRDNNCLNLYPKVIDAMREVVERGGFGTSVTPVSQFYFQQAFANVTQGPWKKITDGYGKMVLGYFGHTPAEPDAEIVKLASEQLGMEPTKEDVHDINDRNPELGVKAATAKLEAAGLPVTDENIFIASTCADKGIEFLKGNKPLGIRYKEDEKPAAKAEKPAAASKAKAGEPESYTVTVDGKAYNVHVAPGGTTVTPAASAPAPAAAPASGGGEQIELTAPMPGTVIKIVVEEGETVEEGDELIILEAMKMETPIKAEKAGTISEILVDQGQAVAAGEAIVLLEGN
jgi:pyruvate carboxylase subunit B